MEEQVSAVQRMQDYIAAHLCEEITLSDLAKASRYSPWYAHRLFVQWLGRTPADYVRRLRLARSALSLRDDGTSVTDAAFAYGFGSVDGYQRAFYREFGCNPREYAKKPGAPVLFTPYGVPDDKPRKRRSARKWNRR
jgi:AraC-like DNA-binding protein